MGNLTRMARGESSGVRAIARVAQRALRALLAISVPVASATAQQTPARLELGGAILAAGDQASYLRTLALLDSTREIPWSIQPFTPTLERRLAAPAGDGTTSPWAGRFTGGSATIQLLRPDVLAIHNSALPVGSNDGVLWAGRGSTVAAQAGVRAQWGRVRLQLAPIIFRAANADYDLLPNGQAGPWVFRDPRRPTQIDLPQRFGSDPYTRIDLGDSFIDVEAFGVAAGFSTARLSWGPARDYPLVQSVNAGGFPHVFIGTAAPVNVGIGTLHVRHIAGRMEQSDWSPIQTGPLHRFHVGFVASFAPNFVPGLEVGGMRVMNVRWHEGTPSLSQLTRPFQGVINDQIGDINKNDENQFASLFLRFSPRASGFEAYAEWAREDFSGNWRWLAMQPDDLGGLTLGVAHAFRSDDGNLHSLRAELVTAEIGHHERLGRTLNQPIPLYWHVRTRQGMTNRGQILGAAAAYGGAGATLAYDRYTANGRLTIALERFLIGDWNQTLGPIGGVPQPEVRYGARAELLRFRGDADWSLQLGPSWTLNHLLVPGNDVFNLNAQLRWRGW